MLSFVEMSKPLKTLLCAAGVEVVVEVREVVEERLAAEGAT